MKPEALLFFRMIFASAFLITLLAGIYIVRNQKRIFGVSAEMPSEGSSSRMYTKFLVYAALLHAMVLFASFALLLH